MRPEAPGDSRRTTIALLGAITAAGVTLRLVLLGDSLFGDEVGAYSIVAGNGPGEIIRILHGNSVDLNPPLFFLLARLASVLGYSPETLKLVSLIAGTAAIPLTYLLGVRTVGGRAALVGAALMAFSPFALFYSTEARPYMLLVALGLLASLALLRALESRQPVWWAAYALASAAAMYTHYTVVFLLLAQFGWAVATHPEARRALVLANVGAAVLFAPWLPAVGENLDSPGTKVLEALHPFGFDSIAKDLSRWAGGHPFTKASEVPGEPALALLVTAVVVALAGLALARRRGLEIRLPAPGLACVLAAAVPAGLAAYSTVGSSVWDGRNLIASLPTFTLVLGAIVTAGPPRVRLAATTLLVAGMAIAAIPMLARENRRPDYEAAARLVERVSRPGDPVVDVLLLTPGPYSAFGDVALRRLGTPDEDRRRRVLRLLGPPLQAVLDAPPYTELPSEPVAGVARRAARLARGRRLFVVAPLEAPFSAVRRSPRFGAYHEFATALPARLRPAGAHTFDSLVPFTVYVLRDRASARRAIR